MNWSKLNPTKWSLSKKITSLILIVLTVPLASLGLLQEIERTLVDSLKDNLILNNQLIASQLVTHPDWFEQSLLPDSKSFIGEDFFVFPIGPSFNLDGYFDEWAEHELHRKYFDNGKQSFSVLLGSLQDYLLLSLKVTDEKVIFPRLDGQTVSDSIEVEFKTSNNQYQLLLLSPTGAGEFAVKTKKNGVMRHDWRYKAYWLLTQDGFTVELKFPSGIKPTEIKISHLDIDVESSQEYQSFLSSSSHDLNPLVWPAQQFADYLNSIVLKPAQRIWLLDHYGRVLATSGNLKTDEMNFSRNAFLNWILSNQFLIESDPKKNLLRLDSEVIYRAMKGLPASQLEYLRDSDNAIAVSAYPLKIFDKVKGVLLLEENVAKVQVLQKKALLRIFTTIIVIFLLAVWVIFWYVNRTVGRIKFLNQEIDKVVDEQGRMSSPLSLKVESGDEIDELYGAFSNMGERLYEYNDYLEKLAARLSHELRTPIAIVRSSLDNLSINCSSKEDRELIDRALDGNNRLGEIISRMKQAAGVKQAMQSSEKENIELVSFIKNMSQGFQLSFPNYKFHFHSDLAPVELMISADLFAEMFDKLISNAMEFSFSGQPIKIEVVQISGVTAIEISNSGPMIPKKNLKRIFHSLVSIRTNEQSNGTNLGMGLYVVRLISDYHGFKVVAKNREDQSGVLIQILCG